jgi:hypothetical protein
MVKANAEATKVTITPEPDNPIPSLGKRIPITREQYLKGEDITMPKKEK